MAYADWSDGDYDYFHDQAFERIFNQMDFEGRTDEEIATAEEYFEMGWLDLNMSYEEALAYKEAFYDVTGYGAEDFDWREFREVYDEANA